MRPVPNQTSTNATPIQLLSHHSIHQLNTHLGQTETHQHPTPRPCRRSPPERPPTSPKKRALSSRTSAQCRHPPEIRVPGVPGVRAGNHRYRYRYNPRVRRTLPVVVLLRPDPDRWVDLSRPFLQDFLQRSTRVTTQPATDEPRGETMCVPRRSTLQPRG